MLVILIRVAVEETSEHFYSADTEAQSNTKAARHIDRPSKDRATGIKELE